MLDTQRLVYSSVFRAVGDRKGVIQGGNQSKKPFYVYFRILHAYTIIYLKYRVYCSLCCKLWHVDTTKPDMHVMWKPHSCTPTFSHMNRSLSDYLMAWKFKKQTAQLSDM